MDGQRPLRPDAIDEPIHWEPSLVFLKAALIFTALGSVAFLAALFTFAPAQTGRATVVLFLPAITGVGWVLLARGQRRAVVWTLAIGVWAYITITSAFLGGVEGTAVIIYPVIILLVGWLVGTRAAAIVAAATSLVTLGFVLAQSRGWLPAPPVTPPAMRWVIQAGVFVMTSVLITYVVRTYRNRLEDVLALAGELNRAQAVAHVGSWICDLASDRMFLSPETCRILGLPAGTIGSHDSYLSRVHADDRAAVEQAWQAALVGGPALDSEHRLSVGSSVRWVRQVGELEWGARGVPIRGIGTVQDITDRRQAEEALRLTRLGVESASEALFWVAPDGRFVDVNGAGCTSLGYTRDELLRLNVSDISPECSAQQWATEVDALRREGSRTSKASHRTKGGRVFPVETRTSHVRIGEDERLCLFVRDISEQMRYEAEILAARRQLEATLDAIPDLLFEVDLEGRYLAMHTPRPELLPAPPDQLIGRTVHEVLPPEAAASCLDAVREAHVSGRSSGKQFELPLPQGRLWFELSVSAKPGAPGVAPRFLVLSRDITLRKRAEEALRAEKTRLECILGSTADGILAVDLEGRAIKTNRRFAELWRIPPGLLEGKDHRPLLEYVCGQLVDPEGFMAKVMSLYRSSAEGFDTLSFRDGRFFERFSAPLVLNGAQAGRVWSFRDVTERKRFEQRLRMATDVTKLVFWELDLPDYRLHFDAEMLPALGLAPATPIETLTAWLGLMHPEDRGPFQERLAAALQPGDPVFDFEHRMLSGVDVTQWLHTRARVVQRDTNGQPTLAVGTSMNVTARKQAEAELRERGSRLSAVFQASPLPIIVSSLETGELLDVNDAGVRLYGSTREDMLGRFPAALQSLPDPAQREELVRLLRERGFIDGFVVDVRLGNGDIRAMEAFGRVIELSGAPCVVALLMDVSERRRLEEVHLQAQKLESLGTLAGGIAHDFNNILVAIRGNADLAAEYLEADHGAAESLAEIRKATSRACELVRRIMVFGRPAEVRHEVLDMRLVVDEVLRLLRPTLPASILLRTEFAGDTPRVVADAGQVHEVVVNLSTNAAYAIGSGAGSISYRLEPVMVGESQAGEIPGLKSGSYARLRVTDTGCGMDAAKLERIFDAFYTTKPVGEGTGLGLSMVHGIMRSHGGAVTAESVPGQGATFAVYFRAAASAATDLTKMGARAGHALADRRVLFVDDEAAIVRVATRMLSRMGYVISGFTDPSEAIEHFRAHPDEFDVVVTDLSMPGVSGLGLARAVLAVRPKLPVVLTTGWVRADDEAAARDIGIRELVLKPVSLSELSQVIDRVARADY